METIIALPQSASQRDAGAWQTLPAFPLHPAIVSENGASDARAAKSQQLAAGDKPRGRPKRKLKASTSVFGGATPTNAVTVETYTRDAP